MSDTRELAELCLRNARRQDLPALVELYNHYVEHSPATFDLTPFDTQSRLQWFERFGTRPEWQLVVAESKGALVGYACSGPFMAKPAYGCSVETSVYVQPSARGLGVGTALYERLFQALSGSSAHRAIAGITLPNDTSVRLHESFGFERVAVFSEVGFKLGRYWDVAWFEKAL